jgi:hypothetical protein
MAKQQGIAPKADQPRASTESLKRTEAPANIQYRVTGIRSSNPRQARQVSRDNKRSM